MSMSMKLKTIAVIAWVGLTSVSAFGVSVYAYTKPNPSSRDEAMGCEKADEIIKAGGRLELGKWYTGFDACKKFADDNGMPLFAIWSNHECIHCWYTDRTFLQPEFKEWATTHNEGKVIYCFMSGGEKGCPDQEGSSAYNWMYYGGGRKLNAYPFVVMWWKAKNVNVRTTGDWLGYGKEVTVSSGFLADSSLPTRVENTIAAMTRAFAGWSPEPPYAGGYFSETNYPYASLQAEASTRFVNVRVERKELAATNQTLKIVAPGKTTASQTISWAANKTNQTIKIDSFDTKWFVKGKKVTLSLLDGATEKSKVEIDCVEPKNSAGNPKWIGESFGFGEWTMDLEAAKAKARAEQGWTLVSVQGSLWCPDCANVERNFLDLEDGSGNNRFAAWAKQHKVALVSIDIPNFNTAGEGCSSPSLLKREAYTTTLARAREYPAAGADAALTNGYLRSGLGYLTRKMVSDDDAAKALTRNHELVVKNTDEGGFHRPEDSNKNRTGVPIFVLLRADGTVAARLTRMASVSPMAEDQANFASYMRRIGEMMTTAEDPTEIGNNYASKGSAAFKANGGSAKGTICHADAVDTFHLDGVGGNALQSVTVSGADAVDVTVSYQTTNQTGVAETLATATGSLSAGVTLEHTFSTAGNYFVKVEAAGITGEGYKLESSLSTLHEFAISGTVVLEPQEDKAVARPPEGSDRVTMRVTAGTVYRLVGIRGGDKLAAVPGGQSWLYMATESGNATITLERTDGEIEYQVWKPGTVGFAKVAEQVTESVCDLDGKPLKIKLVRTGGKSGGITLAVTTNLVTLADYRYEFTPTNVVWTDGDQADKFVEVMINDDLLFDGAGKIELKAEVKASEGGDATVTTGKGIYTLTVVEDDVQTAGRGWFTGAEGDYAKKLTVYAKESEGAKIYAKRADGSDGLVAAILQTPLRGVTFETENPRDISTIDDPDIRAAIGEAAFLYWSNREGGEKWVKVMGVPAGKSAKVSFVPIKPFKTISASNSVTVVSVADDSPCFVEARSEIALTRYAIVSATLSLSDLTGGAVSFTKLSGTLPAGLKARFDAQGQAMVIEGVLTAKAGVYEAVYQAVEQRGSQRVAGLPTKVVFKVTDPTTGGGESGAPLNPAVAKTRTFSGLAAYDGAKKRVIGLMQVTIPANGRLSARLTGLNGTTSFAAKGWSSCGLDGTLVAELTAADGKSALVVEAHPDGSFDMVINGGELDGCAMEHDGATWSAKNPASEWRGYYTVAMKHGEVIGEDQLGIAPTGDGFLTLKMNTTSAVNGGTFTVAGMLPNGTKISGSFKLAKAEGAGWLPVVCTSSREAFAAEVRIAANAIAENNRRCVETPEDTGLAYWRHTERAKVAGSYEVALSLHGGYYDATEDLGGCCAEDYETNELAFYVRGSEKLADIDVGKSTVTASNTGSSKLSLNFNRSTGIAIGKFIDPDLGKWVTYSGIVVNGWGEGCGCGPGQTVFLPFMSGSMYYSEGSPRLTFGEAVKIDKVLVK